MARSVFLGACSGGGLSVSALTVEPSDEGAVVSWTTGQPASTLLLYGETADYGSETPYDPTLETDHEVTLTGLDPETQYHCRAFGADAAGRAGVSDDATFTTDAAPGFSVFAPSETPAGFAAADAGPITVGMQFQVTVNGTITAVRFYKGVDNIGTHTGYVWAVGGGTLLGSKVYSGETASGWQEQALDTPIAVSSGTAYAVGVFVPEGGYGFTSNFFTTTIGDGPVQAPEDDGVVVKNGRYEEAAEPAFPTFTFNKTNYWVDVVFVPD